MSMKLQEHCLCTNHLLTVTYQMPSSAAVQTSCVYLWLNYSTTVLSKASSLPLGRWPRLSQKGCPTHPTNYRPISLLPCIAKLFEKIVAKQLQAYLTIKQKIILCSQQYAYVKEKSATDQLIILTQQMADYIDERLNFDLVSLDFCKAFDRVSHSTLLRQVSKFSDHKVTAWTKSYLQDRSIAVKIESCMSVPKVTNCGVPQGSHLSPLLFVIYINDLPEAIHHSHTFLFADDVTLLLPYKGSLSSPGIQADIHACQSWARERGGEFSPSKISVLSFRYNKASGSIITGTNICHLHYGGSTSSQY